MTWEVVGVHLGDKGMDLREPSDASEMSDILNARFVDDRMIRPRYGHTGALVQDKSSFAPLGSGYSVTDNWVYGHGVQVSGNNAPAWENAHHPIVGRGSATFNYRGANVVHTGDRLLVMQATGPAGGASTYWDREAGTEQPKGIPAFLPVQVDGTPPSVVGGEYVETCLTLRYRAFVDNQNGLCNVWLLDRDTGAVISHADITGGGTDVVEPRIINSGETVVVLWRSYAGASLWTSYWTGSAWATASPVATGAKGYSVALVPGGFHLLYRTATQLVIGKYLQHFPQSTGGIGSYVFGSTPALTAGVPTAECAVGVSPAGDVALAYCSATGLYTQTYSPSLVPAGAWRLTDSAGMGITCTSRGLRNSAGVYDWVLHWQNGGTANACTFTGTSTGTSTKRYNSTIASQAWRVGDEVFCWYRSGNAGTHYLVSGARQQTVCGFSDREEAITRTAHDSNAGVPLVSPDPRDTTYNFTWARPFNTIQSYTRNYSVRYGDIDFDVETCAVQFGRSVYLSGSAVRNWDGITLGDAGFQDYPVITGNPTDAGKQIGGGSLTALGSYYYRVYAVRYNGRGERFESAATSYGPIVLTAGNTKIVLAIATLPDTNHSDLVYEVYRTESLGTTFYLDGTVNNSLTAATVAYTSTQSDALIIKQVADSHAAGVGQLSEIENWGPLGCSMLTSAGDRLWGAGGQVTPGFAQFSKLHEDGSGAGFDDLAGFQEVNTEGEPVTSVIGQNDTVVVFQRNKLYVLSGAGPDNYGRGAFDIPNIVLTDGAITHFGTTQCQVGTLFWGVEGPRLLTLQFMVKTISESVRPLAEGLTPTGVVVFMAQSEVVWYTASGDALLWSYLDGKSRWARWDNLHIAGTSPAALVTPDGRVLVEAEAARGDDGFPFAFSFKTGNLRPSDVLQGATMIREIGLLGAYEGPHQVRFRVSYNGSPCWTDEWIWQPDVATWLTGGTDFAALTPAQVDALAPADKSGAYMTHKRASRIRCHSFRVEVSNISADAPTYVPFELSLEVGMLPGLGRVPANTFTTRIGR